MTNISYLFRGFHFALSTSPFYIICLPQTSFFPIFIFINSFWRCDERSRKFERREGNLPSKKKKKIVAWDVLNGAEANHLLFTCDVVRGIIGKGSREKCLEEKNVFISPTVTNISVRIYKVFSRKNFPFKIQNNLYVRPSFDRIYAMCKIIREKV